MTDSFGKFKINQILRRVCVSKRKERKEHFLLSLWHSVRSVEEDDTIVSLFTRVRTAFPRCPFLNLETVLDQQYISLIVWPPKDVILILQATLLTRRVNR